MILADDVLKVNGGGADAASSATVTLGVDGLGNPWQTSAGSTVVVMAYFNGTGGQTSTLTGFSHDTTDGPNSQTFRKVVSAGETSWTLAVAGGAVNIRWVAVEYPAGTFDSLYPLDVASSGFPTTTSASLTINPQSNAYEGAALVLLTSYDPTNHTPATWQTYPSRYVELYQFQQGDYRVALVMKTTTGVAASGGGGNFTASAVPSSGGLHIGHYTTYMAEGSRRAPDPIWCMGGELVGLPVAGWVNTGGVVNYPIFTDVTGTPSFTATGRTSGHGCLRLSASAAIQYVHKLLNIYSFGTYNYTFVIHFNLIFEGSLPTADTQIAEFTPNGSAAGDSLIFTYRSASQKIGVRFGTTDTEVLSSATMTADTWMGIDLEAVTRTTAFSCRWSLDYNAATTDTTDAVVQTTVSHTAAAAQTGTSWDIYFGWRVAKTATVRIDDVVVAHGGSRGQYPMGDMRVVPVLLDPSATPTVVGTVGDFAPVTANTSGSAFASNAATTAARDNLRSEVWGSSQAGACQLNIGATDRLRFPLTSIDQADLPGLFRALAIYVAGWAASATSCTVKVGYYTTLNGEGYWVGNSSAAVDPNWDNSTTVHSVFWAGMFAANGMPGFTNDPGALSLWFGGSGDATPDPGVLLFKGEAIYQAARRSLVWDLDGVQIVAWEDPLSHGIVAYDLTAPAGFAARATYTISGSNVNHDSAAGTTTRYKVSSADAEAVTFMTAGPN